MAGIYRGIAFPFHAGQQSTPEIAIDDLLIKESIEQILLTGKGERVMRPDFGASIYSYVFENNDDLLGEVIKVEIRAAIAKFEPRAIVTNIDVSKNAEGNAVIVSVSFIVIATRKANTASAQIHL